MQKNAENYKPSRRSYFLSGRQSLAEQSEDPPVQNQPLQDSSGGAPRFVGFDMNGQKMEAPPPQPEKNISQVPVFSNEKSREQLLAEVMSGALSGNPYFDKIRENQAKLIALRGMPTYVNKKGETVRGMRDEDGRLQSGLKALVARLATMGPTPDWGSFGAGLAGAASAGVTGAIMPEWNEWAERERQMQRLEQENEQLLGYGQKDWQYRREQAQLGLSAEKEAARQEQFNTRESRLNRQLDDRVSRNKILNLRDEQKMFLEPIMKRGYFYEEDTDPATLERMRALGIVLPDFDNRYKPQEQNGVWMGYNPETRKYEQVEGMPQDPDETPMTFMVDGEKITASAKHFLNYKAGLERQEKQQSFTASENEKNRNLRRELQANAQKHGREQTVKKAVEAWMRLYYRENGQNPTEEEINNYRSFVESNLSQEPE